MSGLLISPRMDCRFPWLALGWDRDFTPPMTGQDGPRIVVRGEGTELVLRQTLRLVPGERSLACSHHAS